MKYRVDDPEFMSALERCLDAGMTASEAAAEMTWELGIRVTRNMLCGLVHRSKGRLEWKSGNRGGGARPRPRPKPPEIPIDPPQPEPQPMVHRKTPRKKPMEVLTGRPTLGEPEATGPLGTFPDDSRGCRWIIGDPKADWRCCNHDRKLASPYCDFHDRLSRQSGTALRKVA